MPIDDGHKKDLARHVVAHHRALIEALREWARLHPEDKVRPAYVKGFETVKAFDAYIDKADQ